MATLTHGRRRRNRPLSGEKSAYGPDAPITYCNSDWYDAHQSDEHMHWRADPENVREYYERDGSWRDDSGARALAGGATGAGVGAAIGVL